MVNLNAHSPSDEIVSFQKRSLVKWCVCVLVVFMLFVCLCCVLLNDVCMTSGMPILNVCVCLCAGAHCNGWAFIDQWYLIYSI